jgi:hypothetical protein
LRKLNVTKCGAPVQGFKASLDGRAWSDSAAAAVTQPLVKKVESLSWKTCFRATNTWGHLMARELQERGPVAETILAHPARLASPSSKDPFSKKNWS